MTAQTERSYRWATEREWSSDLLNDERDRMEIATIQRKMKSNPKKAEKYEHQLQQKVQKMDVARKKRISNRLDFLRSFYVALYTKKPAEFTKKYHKICTDAVLYLLSAIYRQNHGGQKGYAWFVFGDNQMHHPEELTMTVLDSGTNIGVERYDDFLSNQTENYSGGQYPFAILDPKWYKVSMNGHDVYVRIEGEKNTLLVTGLLNTYLDVMVKEPPRYLKNRHIIDD